MKIQITIEIADDATTAVSDMDREARMIIRDNLEAALQSASMGNIHETIYFGDDIAAKFAVSE